MSATGELVWGLLITAIMGGVIAYVKRNVSKIKAINGGIRCILYVEIKKHYYAWQHETWCPLYILEDVEEMFKQYTALDGNGAIKSIVEELRNKPHVKL